MARFEIFIFLYRSNTSRGERGEEEEGETKKLRFPACSRGLGAVREEGRAGSAVGDVTWAPEAGRRSGWAERGPGGLRARPVRGAGRAVPAPPERRAWGRGPGTGLGLGSARLLPAPLRAGGCGGALSRAELAPPDAARQPSRRRWGAGAMAETGSLHATRFEAAVKVIQSLPKNGECGGGSGGSGAIRAGRAPAAGRARRGEAAAAAGSGRQLKKRWKARPYCCSPPRGPSEQLLSPAPGPGNLSAPRGFSLPEILKLL